MKGREFSSWNGTETEKDKNFGIKFNELRV